MRAVRGIVIAAVIVALLGGAPLYADARFHSRTESEVSVALQQQLGTPERPTVDIEGRFFLPQIAARSIKTVRVSADQVGVVTEAPLTIKHTDLILSDVTSGDWFATMTVAHAEGTAQVDYAALQSLAGVPLTYIGDGRVEIVVSASVLGRNVAAKITGEPSLNVKDQTISLRGPKVRVANVDLPDFTAQALLRALLKPIPLTGMPFGLTINTITAGDAGLQTEISGDNLPVSR